MTDESSGAGSEPVGDAVDEAGREALEGELLTRLRVIENQPLAARATAYAQLHDELRSRLEGGDASGARG